MFPGKRAQAGSRPKTRPAMLGTSVLLGHKPLVPVLGTFLIPKSLKLQLSGCGQHPWGRPQGQGDIHHHIRMLCAFSHFLSCVLGGFGGVACMTSQQTESKQESSAAFCLGKHYRDQETPNMPILPLKCCLGKLTFIRMLFSITCNGFVIVILK